MIALPETVILPLKMDEHGAIRVSGTRVTLDTLIAFYRQGETPEDLHEGFPTVPLADIYAVIAYYLGHQAEVDAYLKRRDEEAERIRQEWEARHPPPTKAELLARLDARWRGEWFLADENFNGKLLAGLRAVLPEIDIVRVPTPDSGREVACGLRYATLMVWLSLWLYVV